MSRPFRLAGLLRLRAISEDQAAAELARRTRQRDAAERERRRTQESLGDAVLPDGADALGFQAIIASRVALSRLLVECRETEAQAQTEVARADEDWARARTATRTLEKLEERHTEAERVTEQRDEQKILDEVAGRRRTGSTAPVAVTGPEEDR